MQIYANYTQIHIKIASCAPPYLLERILPAFYYSFGSCQPSHLPPQKGPHLEGGRGARVECVPSCRVGACSEASEDSVRAALRSDLGGWSRINFKIPGSEALHPTPPFNQLHRTAHHHPVTVPLRPGALQKEPRKLGPGFEMPGFFAAHKAGTDPRPAHPTHALRAH